MATGRAVLDVARESFALTLYTWWHLEQRRYLDAIARRLERFDLAGGMAQAMHDPAKLHESYEMFLAELRPAMPSVRPDAATLARERQLAVVRAAHSAHQTVTPLTLH